MRFSLQRAQVTRVGVAAFHCERRLRVLDREVFRFGTGTVVPYLLSLMWFYEARKCGPARIGRVVQVSGIIVEPDAAFGAQARTILATQRGHRKGQHHGIAKRWLKIDEIVVDQRQRIVILTGLLDHRAPGIRGGVDEELGEIDVFLPVDRIQAAGAFRVHAQVRRTGHQDPLEDRFKTQVNLDR